MGVGRFWVEMVECAEVIIHVASMGKLGERVMVIALIKSIAHHSFCVWKHNGFEASGGISGGGGCAGGFELVIMSFKYQTLNRNLSGFERR